MKKYDYVLIIWIGLISIFLVSCSSAGEHSATLTVVKSTVSLTVIVPPVDTVRVTSTPTPTSTNIHPTETVLPPDTLTPTPEQFELPDAGMSPQEAANALGELLRTNGNCTDKCVAGIWPDEMNVQQAAATMTKWGNVRRGENSLGQTFINLVQNPLYDRVIVYLSVGTWTKELGSIDSVLLRIEGTSESILGEKDDNFWLANRDSLMGYQLDRILQDYGVPSYVGYFFQTDVEVGEPLEGRTILYTMNIHYKQIDLVVQIGALAHYNGENLSICPSKDPHNLWIEIYPERPMKDLEEFYPVTWEAITNTDLEVFYNKFTNESNPDACVETTLEQIQALQPYFR